MHAPVQPSDDRPIARGRRLHRIVAGLLLAGLAVVPLACGGDDGGSESGSGANQDTDEAVADRGEGDDADATRRRVAEAFQAEVNSGLGGTEAEVSDEQADCAAEGIIDALGVRRATGLYEAGEQATFTPEEAEKIVPVAKRCLNFAELLAQEILQEAEGKISASAAGCVAGKLEDTPLIDDALTAALTGTEVDPTQDEQSSKTLLDAVTSCLSPEDLQKLGS